MMASHPPSCTTHTIYNRSMVPVACQSACSSVSSADHDALRRQWKVAAGAHRLQTFASLNRTSTVPVFAESSVTPIRPLALVESVTDVKK